MAGTLELQTAEPAIAAAQPFLFSEQTIAELTNAEKQGRYTLERLCKLRPEAIDEIIRLRGEFVGKLRIAEIVRVAHETVTAVDSAYAEDISIARSNRVTRLRSAADKLVEMVDQNPGLVPWNVKCLAASQLYDKAELLDGRATVRVEDIKRVDIYSDWPAFVKKHLAPEDAVEIGSERKKDLAIGNGDSLNGEAGQD